MALPGQPPPRRGARGPPRLPYRVAVPLSLKRLVALGIPPDNRSGRGLVIIRPETLTSTRAPRRALEASRPPRGRPPRGRRRGRPGRPGEEGGDAQGGGGVRELRRRIGPAQELVRDEDPEEGDENPADEEEEPLVQGGEGLPAGPPGGAPP